MIIAMLMQVVFAGSCAPTDYLCNTGRPPTFSELEQRRMVEQRAQVEADFQAVQSAATRSAYDSQAERARLLPSRVSDLVADGRCGDAADAALVGGEIDLAQQVRAHCGRKP